MDRRDKLALALLAQLQRLAAPGPGETAALMTVRSATGDWIGEVRLSEKAAEALTDGVMSIADYAEQPDALPYDAPVVYELADPRVQTDLEALKDAFQAQLGRGVPATAQLDPGTLADLQDHFDGLDLTALTGDVLNTVAPADRMRATLAIDDVLGHIPTQDLDGDL